MGSQTLRGAYNLLIIARCLGCETNLQESMCLESSDVARFDLDPSFKVKNGSKS